MKEACPDILVWRAIECVKRAAFLAPPKARYQTARKLQRENSSSRRVQIGLMPGPHKRAIINRSTTLSNETSEHGNRVTSLNPPNAGPHPVRECKTRENLSSSYPAQVRPSPVEMARQQTDQTRTHETGATKCISAKATPRNARDRQAKKLNR